MFLRRVVAQKTARPFSKQGNYMSQFLFHGSLEVTAVVRDPMRYGQPTVTMIRQDKVAGELVLDGSLIFQLDMDLRRQTDREEGFNVGDQFVVAIQLLEKGPVSVTD